VTARCTKHRTAADILSDHRINTESTLPGRYYTTCPKCSAARSRAHQRAPCLGVTITAENVTFGCNHCGWTGGGKCNGRANGHAYKPRTGFVATYDYTDENGELLFQVCRTPGKDFPQRRPDGKGGWKWSTNGARKVLYRLPEVLEAIATEHMIVIVEGEKDADNLWRIGVPASCSPGGASKPGQEPKWKPEYSEALRDADVVIIPDNDEPGRAHAEAIAYGCVNIAARVRVLDLAKSWAECSRGGDVSDWLAADHTREEFDALVEQAPDWNPYTQQQAKPNCAGSLRTVRVADVKAQPVTWLWPGRLARGKLTLIAGDPGIGKSQISTDITARTTTGARWPDGGLAPCGNVIMLSAEDSIADVMRPRLEVAQADLSRVHVIEAAIQQNGKERSFSIQADLEQLRTAVASIGNVPLITLDPLTSYMGSIDSHRTTDVRAVLEPLARFADETGIAILAISHPPKATQSKAIHAVTGSLAFVAAARMVFIAVEEPETDRRLLLPVKSNLSAPAAGLGYRLAQRMTAQNIVASQVEWDSAPVTVTANEAVRAGSSDKNKIAEAKELLSEELANGPLLAETIIALAGRLDISERTLRRARKDMNISITKDGFQGPWMWSLPTWQ
jgi:hypothetical protein